MPLSEPLAGSMVTVAVSVWFGRSASVTTTSGNGVAVARSVVSMAPEMPEIAGPSLAEVIRTVVVSSLALEPEASSAVTVKRTVSVVPGANRFSVGV